MAARGARLILVLCCCAIVARADAADERNFLACANHIVSVCYDPWQVDDGGTLRHSGATHVRDPFVCHARIRDVPLARLLERKGWKLHLSNGTHARWASFNTVDEDMRRCCPVDRFYIFRDLYTFNVLAHELLSALNCSRVVPSAVVRRFEGLGVGALTQWVDCRADEMERAVQNVPLAHVQRMHNLTWVVTELVADPDRNVHNILYSREPTPRLVLVDFTRAFRRSLALRWQELYATIEAPMWDALQRVRLDAFGAPTLDDEIRAGLEARRAAMVAHFAALIETRGRDAVVLPAAGDGAQC